MSKSICVRDLTCCKSALIHWRAHHLISARIFSRLLVSRSVSRDSEARCSSWLFATSPLNPAIRDSCSRMACTRTPTRGLQRCHAADISQGLPGPLQLLHTSWHAPCMHPSETTALLADQRGPSAAPHLFKGWFGHKLLHHLLFVQAHDLREHLCHLLRLGSRQTYLLKTSHLHVDQRASHDDRG